jgi:hypothetical protein
LINSPVTALKAILFNNSNITSLLGHYQGTTIPLIKSGILPEVETALPCITFYMNNHDPENFLNDITFTVNCYAGNSAGQYDAYDNSNDLAEVVVKELNQCDSGIDGYQARTTARILTTVPDPSGNEVNTPVEIRIVNIFN